MPGPLLSPQPTELLVDLAAPSRFATFRNEGLDELVLMHPLTALLHGAISGRLPREGEACIDLDALRAKLSLPMSVDELRLRPAGNLLDLINLLGVALVGFLPEEGLPEELRAHRKTVNLVAHELRRVVQAELRAEYEMLAGLKGPPGWGLFDSGCWAKPFAYWDAGWRFCDAHAERHEDHEYTFVGWKITTYDKDGEATSHGILDRREVGDLVEEFAQAKGWRQFGPNGRWTYLVTRLWDLRIFHEAAPARPDVVASLAHHKAELMNEAKSETWGALASALLELEGPVVKGETLEGLENHPLLGAPAPAGGAR